MARMMTQAGSGDAPRTQGGRGNADYIAKIAAKIRSNTAFVIPPNLAGNPAVEYSIELLPDGSLRRLKLMKPSGIPGFDEAVRNGIEKSQPYPADKSGRIPSGAIVIEYRPIDDQ
jgi:colicin import membrane protein